MQVLVIKLKSDAPGFVFIVRDLSEYFEKEKRDLNADFVPRIVDQVFKDRIVHLGYGSLLRDTRGGLMGKIQ